VQVTVQAADTVAVLPRKVRPAVAVAADHTVQAAKSPQEETNAAAESNLGSTSTCVETNLGSTKVIHEAKAVQESHAAQESKAAAASKAVVPRKVRPVCIVLETAANLVLASALASSAADEALEAQSKQFWKQTETKSVETFSMVDPTFQYPDFPFGKGAPTFASFHTDALSPHALPTYKPRASHRGECVSLDPSIFTGPAVYTGPRGHSPFKHAKCSMLKFSMLLDAGEAASRRQLELPADLDVSYRSMPEVPACCTKNLLVDSTDPYAGVLTMYLTPACTITITIDSTSISQP
jgi:hypothetical protein